MTPDVMEILTEHTRFVICINLVLVLVQICISDLFALLKPSAPRSRLYRHSPS